MIGLLLDTTVPGVNPGALAPETPASRVRSTLTIISITPPTSPGLPSGSTGARPISGSASQNVAATSCTTTLCATSADPVFRPVVEALAALLTDICHGSLWVSHAGHVYVDDRLCSSLASFGLLPSSLVLLISVALGVPVSWKKLQVGKPIPMAWLDPRPYRPRVTPPLSPRLTTLCGS